ncbi:hypothetical protein Taro_030890 [Colocasia esculenta]|uniref:Uncharacterized protein n=1 Tax=Colocasia esculenta TaxID=4460 RepID=A0A843VMJ7_COLES|nr:hypothetical protein [Colocasia esculenta]
MAVVVLVGNLAPSTEITFPRSSLPPLDHLRSSSSGKSRLYHLQDSTFIWARREPCTATSASTSTWAGTSSAIFLASISKGSISRGCCFRDGENRPLAAAWMWCRSRRSRPVAANFAGGAGGVGGGGESDEEDEGKDWEDKLRGRLKELEEMKELERRAEELRSRMMSEEGGEDGETEEEKRERVRKELEKLEQLAKEQTERRETAKLMFDLGQKAYGKGMYARAIEFLEGALTIIPRPTLLGGEVQIWLAMAYEANNRHRDCIDLYKQLEQTHPSVSIRRQAAELRYILQAPKLKISKEEMVTIPLIGSSYDRYAGTWTDKNKDQEKRKKVATANQSSSSTNYWGDFIEWRPPADWEKSRAFWLAVTLLLALVGLALLQN